MNTTTAATAAPHNTTSPLPLAEQYILGYQDAVHNAINITAYDSSPHYQKGFSDGCEDMRLGESLCGEREEF